jgi:hypothetical protein
MSFSNMLIAAERERQESFDRRWPGGERERIDAMYHTDETLRGCIPRWCATPTAEEKAQQDTENSLREGN